MANNKFKKIAALGLLTIFGLTACDDIEALPKNFDEKVVVTDQDIFNNSLESIFDSLHDGSLASDVLDEVLYQYAVSIFGYYNKVLAPVVKDANGNDTQAITLKDAAASVKNEDYAKADEFIKAHKAYWDNKDEESESHTVTDAERTRVLAKWNSLEKKIADKFFDGIKGGAYSERGYFSELDYLSTLKFANHDVADFRGNTNLYTEEDELIILPSDESEVVFTKYLHRANYQLNAGLDEVEAAGQAVQYVEKEIIPGFYRDLLTEQYILEQTYNTLGRSNAREVNVITISNNSEFNDAAPALMSNFITNLSAKPEFDGEGNRTNGIDKEDFDLYSNVWTGKCDYKKVKEVSELPVIGVNGVIYKTTGDGKFYTKDGSDAAEEVAAPQISEIQTILDEIGEDYFPISHVTVSGKTRFYVQGTAYGDLLDDYSKIKNNELTSDSSQESAFTNNNAYSKETGLKIKENELEGSKYFVTSGWFTKDSLSSVSSTITSRLFKSEVAAAVDAKEEKAVLKDGVVSLGKGDRWYQEYNEDGTLVDGTWKYSADRDVNKYVAKINGSYFLKSAGTEYSSAKEGYAGDVLFYDSSSSSYSVVQINNAVNSTKLAKDSEKNYAALKSTKEMEDIRNEVLDLVASNSTYTSIAKEYWLEQMNLKYHDQSVYDYFESNFPELFED